MGVQQSEEIYKRIKELLQIPLDEPIFIFRAQDRFTPRTLRYYKEDIYDQTVVSANPQQREWLEDLTRRYAEFKEWQHNNRGKVKRPD